MVSTRHSGTIRISNDQGKKIPTCTINQHLKASCIQAEKVQTAGYTISEFRNKLEGLKPGQEQDVTKENKLKRESIKVEETLLVILPKILQFKSTFTHLALFSILAAGDTKALVYILRKET